jgi:ribosomal protein S12 methylthiotransferase
MSVQNEISAQKHQDMIGKTVSVLVEGYSEETELLLVGRHFGQAPDIDGVTYINEGEANVGDIVQVKISDAHDYDLVGTIV